MPGYGARYWAERTAPNRRRKHPSFKGRQETDVVVVGGGLTGCACASAIAAGGMKVILLEADRVAEGGTGAGLGAIVPEPDVRFRDADKLAGRRVARVGWKESHRSALELAAALKKLRTKCDLQPADFVINAATTEDLETLRREQIARRGAGVVAPWMAGPAVTREIGAESVGALRLHGAFLFDPVRAALGLADAAEQSGARIYEQSAVRRTTFTRRYADVILATGTIRTRGIVVATGEPVGFVGQLRRHVRRQTGYAVATAPLSAAMRREFTGKPAITTEARSDSHWWRPLTDDRILFTGAVSRPVAARLRDKSVIQRTAQLMYELSLRYPAISGLPAAWGWDMPVVSGPDGLPWIGPHRNYPFHFFALAFGWHGDGLAWLAAKAALRYFQGDSRREDDVFGFVRHL
jgi:glycine/D-amino acid oxidase-like deaminating enzyme